MASLPGGRPVRATRGKRTTLAAGFVDSSALRIDSDDEIEDDWHVKSTKKARLASSSDIEDEEEFETSRSPNSSIAGSESSSRSPSPEPEPQPWELKYHETTYLAVERLIKIIGPRPPDTDELDVAIKAVRDALLPEQLKSHTPEPQKLVVRLRLPPGTIDKNPSYRSSKAGFMDLPGELRNQIYLLAFKTEQQIDFKGRKGFPHSAAFLRVNKAVYNEARVVLYGSNRFVFDQSTCRTGRYYESQWKETNYRYIREFLTAIGPENISLITNIGLHLEDGTPSGHPGTSMNARRFENNKDLYWILKHLARHGKIEKLKLGFSGRRLMRLHRSEAAFIHALAAVKADVLEFGNPHTESNGSDWFERTHYGKVDETLKDTLKEVMVRPLPLKLLDPRLQF